jgi:hypothetical protein
MTIHNAAPQPIQPPVKANLIIVRGRNGAEIRGEDWDTIQHQVYTGLINKRRDERSNSYYDLVVLVPGMAPMRSECVIYRGCNCIAVDSNVVMYL